MSEVKVNKISPRTNCGTVTVGDSGDAVCVSAGVPVTVQGDLKSPALKATDGGVIISQSGTDITIGASGDTINLASGASQTGFGRTGTVDWQTGDIKTAEFTAATGKGYFVNTTSGGVTVNLPAGSAGDIVGLKDYAATWDSNAVTLAPNGSEKIGGDNAADPTVDNEGGSLLLVYVDSTQGWLTTQQSVTASPTGSETFIVASGGTPCSGAISGDYKYHKFTGPGTFTVSTAGEGGVLQTDVSYMVVAGGGGGGWCTGGGGGAGGFREAKVTGDPYTASPLDGYGTPGNKITVSATAYPITVGGGGAGGGPPGDCNAVSGSNSIFSTITSAGGGGAASRGPANFKGTAGGSGGGDSGSAAAPQTTKPAGNTPSTTPAQGTDGGLGGLASPTGPSGSNNTGGGGGATVGGSCGTGSPLAMGPGGAGATTSIDATPTAYAGGGGGGAGYPNGAQATGGTGGGGTGAGPGGGQTAGGTNLGGGGGGGSHPYYPQVPGSAGGSGIVIIRYKFQ